MDPQAEAGQPLAYARGYTCVALRTQALIRVCSTLMKENRQHAGFSLRSRFLGAGWGCARRISPVSVCGLPLASSPRQKMKDVRSMKCRLTWSKAIASNLFERDRRV